LGGICQVYGWTLNKISEALFLDSKTILLYRKLYEEGGVDRLCCDELKGNFCLLNDKQLVSLQKHLREHLYSTTAEIVAYIVADTVIVELKD